MSLCPKCGVTWLASDTIRCRCVSAPQAGAPTPGPYRVEPSARIDWPGIMHPFRIVGPNGFMRDAYIGSDSANEDCNLLNAAYAAGLEAAARFVDDLPGVRCDCQFLANGIRALAGADQNHGGSK